MTGPSHPLTLLPPRRWGEWQRRFPPPRAKRVLGEVGHLGETTWFPRPEKSREGDYALLVASDQSQKLDDLTWLRRVRDRIDREYEQPLDVEALASGAYMSAGHLSRQFKLAYGESPYSYLMTRRIERAMALLRRGDLNVTEVCFTVGFSSLGTFSTRFTELVGVPPSVFREEKEIRATAGMPACVAKQVTRPIRNREASASGLAIR